MKTIVKSLVATFAVFGFVSCSQETITPDENVSSKVSFFAEAGDVTTKSTLTPDESDAVFKSAWKDNDALSVEYMNFSDEKQGIVKAVWNGKSFDATLTGAKGEWSYDAIYPAPDTDGKTDFGGERIQSGNDYNGMYDIMKASVTVNDGEAGKMDDGSDVHFNMERQTAIAYFHFNGAIDETVISATLSVEDGYIASSVTQVKTDSYSSGYVPSKDLKSIKVTFAENTAPSAKDLKLWFNVLPTTYSSLSLTIETTGHIATITNANKDEYIAGQLYKVSGNIDGKYVVKPQVEDKVYFYESFDGNDGTGGNDGAWNGQIATSSSKSDNTSWSFTNEKGAYQCIKLGASNKAGKAITPALNLTSSVVNLSFMSGSWKDDKAMLQVSISKGVINGNSSTTTFELGNASWTSYDFVLSGVDKTTKITFSSNKRFFLDEVYVYTGKKPVKKSVQKFSFDKSAYSCFVDESFSAPNISGAKTDVEYSSSNQNVATVDASTGVVNIVGVGETEISAKAIETEEYYGAVASYKLTVSKHVQTLSFEAPVYKVLISDKDKFVSPKVSGAQTDVTYSIVLEEGTEEDAFTIDSKTGEVTINAAGSATVTASANESDSYLSAFASYKLTVLSAPEQFKVTYTVSSTTSVTKSGVAPAGSSVTFNNTYSTKDQMTSGKSQTYTINGYNGKTIKKVVLSMKSNSKAGAGTFSLKAGQTTLASISSSTTFDKWFDNTSYSTSYKDVNVTMTNDSYVIGANESVVLTIAATTNSLYCQSVTIYYE